MICLYFITRLLFLKTFTSCVENEELFVTPLSDVFVNDSPYMETIRPIPIY